MTPSIQQTKPRLFGDTKTALAPEALSGGLALRAALVILVGAFAYGFVFGIWRAPLQGLYAAIKLPAVFFTVILASGLINAVLASLLGTRLGFRQVGMAMLIAMASTAAILGSLSPVVLFLLHQVESADTMAAADAMQTFWMLLLTHVSIIGAAGLAGYRRLRAMLTGAIGDRKLARRVLLAWIAVSGFVGCEISWLYSPFLCKPNYEPHFIAREYGQGNFYQQIWRGLQSITVPR
jgi:hypothetical protein